MSDKCCPAPSNAPNASYRKILTIALVINFLMFIAEVITSYYSNSVALLADSVDFLGDAANYGISLFVLNLALKVRARASIIKAATMAVFGIAVICSVIYQVFTKELPNAETMGVVGILALLANVFVAILLYKFREGDSNMRSVWLCTRNDAIGNILVLVAAGGVALTGTLWPDLIVGLVMGYLGLSAATRIYLQAKAEIKSVK